MTYPHRGTARLFAMIAAGELALTTAERPLAECRCVDNGRAARHAEWC